MVTTMRQEGIPSAKHSHLVGHRLPSLVHSFNPIMLGFEIWNWGFGLEMLNSNRI